MRCSAATMFALSAACHGGEVEQEDSFTTRLSVVEELRIGSPDDPTFAFTWFVGLEVAPDGRIYTMHPQEATIRVHTAAGEPLPSIGRRGDGPGEFNRLAAMGVIGDTLWALDIGTYRFSYFSYDGTLLASRRIPIDYGSGVPVGREDLARRLRSARRPRGLLSDGRVWGAPIAYNDFVAKGWISEQALVVEDSTNQFVDTLVITPLTNSVWEIRDPDKPRSDGVTRSAPFSDTEIVTLFPYAPMVYRLDRTVRPDSAHTLRITAVTFGDSVLWSRAYAYTPRTISPLQIDSLVDAFVGRAVEEHGLAPARAARWARDNLYVPAHHPAVSSMIVGRDGTIWLAGPNDGASARDWMIIDSDGEALGSVTLPYRFQVQHAHGLVAWGMDLDELDVPYLVRFRAAPRGER